jgi:hypothetical protein
MATLIDDLVLLSRNRKRLNDHYPELAEPASACGRAKPCCGAC